MLCRKKTFVARYTRSKTNFWTLYRPKVDR